MAVKGKSDPADIPMQNQVGSLELPHTLKVAKFS